MIYYEEPYVTIRWDEVIKCVHVEWKGFVYDKQVKVALNKALELFSQHNTDRWLADTHLLKVVDQEDQKWVNENWFPRAIAAGVRRMALIIPESVLAQMSLKKVINKANQSELETAYFSSVNEAKKWLVDTKALEGTKRNMSRL